MAGCGKKALQEEAHVSRRTGTSRISTAAYHTEKRILRKRAGCPTFHRRGFFKEMKRRTAMGMIGIPQGDQNIGVEKVNHLATFVAISNILESSSSY